jgi:integrase
MSIRKRVWETKHGTREAWIVDYTDQEGHRHIKTFKRKRDADDYAAKTHVQIGEGTHVADSASVTVKEAGDLWLKSARAAGLELSTIEQYEQHLRLHITTFIGRRKLSEVTAPFVRAFQDKLHQEGRSPAMIRGVVGSLGALLADAQERGLVVRNAVRELRGRRRRRSATGQDRRNGKLKIGIDIPARDDVRAILDNAKGRWRPFLRTAVMTGLRASELRGLRWDDVDLNKGELHVRQRADKYNAIGRPKSAAGERTIPLTPVLAQELREWKLKCPKKDGKLGLVFPNGEGNVESHANIVQRGLLPTMLAAGVTVPTLDEQGNPKRDDEGKPIVKPKYSGLHAFRHFFASWCINRKSDGGLELPAKVVQERLGHASIVMTMDRYGHLFPRGDDTAELAAAEKALLGH